MTERALQFLRGLPDVEPPAFLWRRIERAQSRRRTLRRAIPIAMAAVLMLGVFVARDVIVRSAQPDDGAAARSRVASPYVGEPAVVDRGVADTIVRSHALERDLAAVRATGGRASLSLEAELARVDSKLSRAYARRAGDEELRALWSARVAALETLVAAHRHPDAIRI